MTDKTEEEKLDDFITFVQFVVHTMKQWPHTDQLTGISYIVDGLSTKSCHSQEILRKLGSVCNPDHKLSEPLSAADATKH